MAMEKSPRRKKNGELALNNNLLLILIVILSVVLVALLILGGMLLGGDDVDPTEQMQGSGTSSSADPSVPSSSVTTPSSVPQPSTDPEPTEPAPTHPVTPDTDKYINVGSGYIAEVVQSNIETFTGNTHDDYSRPTNNYLPEGTVDYCSRDYVYNSSQKYVLLRSGHRVYFDKKVYPPVRKEPEVKQYAGWLPDHNEIDVVSMDVVENHTVLTLNCLWKAPFYFETNQSGYANPDGGSDRDYAIAGNNATYIDITFCYATEFRGNIVLPSANPLFKSIEIVDNGVDHTMRLHLRKAGGFYGWHAYYNDQGQLCFQFLNPAKASAADNKYGADLTGVTVLLDVGHGGVDGGASATDANGTTWKESDVNLMLANQLKLELESMGATVLLNRYDNSAIDINARQKDLLKKSPDICIAIHQNSYSSEKVGGFDSMYFTSWSHLLAKYIRTNTQNSGIYAKTWLRWSVSYFMMRQTVCPVVLTENGYMTNPDDLAAMVDPVKIEGKANAIAQGVADYFLAINK